ncbi:MAG: CbtB-domain containing protein [Actinomycetota bacterium]|nr:CbtB-domain containing protein [Actinomycetota bacterium]
MASIASSPSSADLVVGAGTRWPGIAAMVLGAFFILGTGFSHISAVHNAAHDARHSAGFPCH